MTSYAIICACKRYMGLPYVWGGESMREGGYDCSGFLYNVLRDCFLNVGRRTAQGYSNMGIEVDEPEKGDLLFFGSSRNNITHVAIYAGYDMMYESIGNASNDKLHPGKGVVLSRLDRRNDLVLIKRICNDTSDAAYSLKAFIKDVQSEIGAVVDGIAGDETISKTPTISCHKNRKHPVVKHIQRRLNTMCFKCGTVDGIAGPKFDSAVKAFQKANECVVDGELTARNKTWRKILGM